METRNVWIHSSNLIHLHLIVTVVLSRYFLIAYQIFLQQPWVRVSSPAVSMVEAVITNLEIPDHDGKGNVSHISSIFLKILFCQSIVDMTCAQQQVCCNELQPASVTWCIRCDQWLMSHRVSSGSGSVTSCSSLLQRRSWSRWRARPPPPWSSAASGCCWRCAATAGRSATPSTSTTRTPGLGASGNCETLVTVEH